MQKISLIGRKNYRLSNGITLHIPTLDEIRGENDNSEDEYYSLINLFITTSTDYMVELDSIDINFEELEDDWKFFLMKISMVKEKKDCHLLFEGLNYCQFDITEDSNDNIIVYDVINGIKITQDIFYEISDVVCKMHFRKKSHRKFANERSRKFAINKIIKTRKRAKPQTSSELDGVILFAVCNKGFKYNFETVGTLTIYDFYACVKQIQRDSHIDNLMVGGYTGHIKLEEIAPHDLNRLETI